MRIGIDAQNLGQREAGVSGCVRRLIEALAAEDRENEYFIYTHAATSPLNLQGNERFHVVLSELPTKFRAMRILWQQTILPHNLERDRVDLLHATAYVSPLLSPCPIVLTIYDAIAIMFPHLCKQANALHYGLFLPRCVARAARIIAPSERTREDLVRFLGTEAGKIVVIPPGVGSEFRRVEDEKRCAEVAARLGLPRQFILFVGNIEAKKNISTLIRAFARLRRAGRIPHKLVIAGHKRWKCEDVFRAVEEEKVWDEVCFCGYVDLRDLPVLYSLADLFVFPSLYEGFGLPPLEAMACGTPVIASTRGALPEVLGEAALLLEPDDLDGLQKAIYKVLHNRFLRQHLEQEGLKRAAKFTWAEAARKTIALYAEVCAQAPRARKK